jgi:hypothetical protein
MTPRDCDWLGEPSLFLGYGLLLSYPFLVSVGRSRADELSCLLWIGPTGQCRRPCVLESTWHGCGRGSWIRIGSDRMPG